MYCQSFSARFSIVFQGELISSIAAHEYELGPLQVGYWARVDTLKIRSATLSPSRPASPIIGSESEAP